MRGSIALLITLSVLLSVGAQIALKGGMMSDAVQRPMAAGGGVTRIIHILFNPFVLLGLSFHGLSAAVWLLVLARVPVSTACPFVAAAIVLTSSPGRTVYHEPFLPAKIAATLLIVGGVVVMAKA